MTGDRPGMPCRLLPHEVADGASNMGTDLALLEAVDAEPTAAVLRTYEWSEPTLSLGYFQPIAAAEAEARFRGAPWVRRPSGGGALWHDREVTYALVLPRSHPAAARASGLYRAVHAAIAGALRRRGIDAGRRGESEALAAPPFLCFADRDPEDVVFARGGPKLVGSAQRRRTRAVLQHGALLLGRSGATPELPGLREVAGAGDPGPARAWGEAIARAVAEALGLELRPGEPAEGERREASRLAREVFLDPGWTRRR
jgi:lipoate-protein ligase A